MKDQAFNIHPELKKHVTEANLKFEKELTDSKVEKVG